ncbi:MAG: iron-containing alcohol dehydrogenase [Clostridiales bacterium]|nr:iron-containing alcohol dehydrogenase [Clostridiales bacterium]
MNKYLCRIVQGVMKLSMYCLPWTMPEVKDGAGSSKALAQEIRRQGINCVLVVMGGNMMKRGLPLTMLRNIETEGIRYRVFDNLTADPTDKNVEAAVKAYYDVGAKGIVLFGGGSPMDCGKAVAARIARPHKSIDKLQGVLKVRHRKQIPYIWAIPTTSGTGSETTMAAVITDYKTNRKKSINDISIIPHACILDPELTLGLPQKITADTGMDALCHAVECYTNGTYNTKVENDMAQKAVRLIYQWLYAAYEDGGNIEARENMQKAAFYAGRAFTRGCVGYVHAIGHAIGGLYHVPHGRAMAVILPHVMRCYGSAAEKRLSELGAVCGIAGGGKGFIRWIVELNESMGIPHGFDCIKKEDAPKIALWAEKEANPLYPVPKVFSAKELEELILTISR